MSVDFDAPISRPRSPRLPPLTLFGILSQINQRWRSEQCQKWHARQSRLHMYRVGGGICNSQFAIRNSEWVPEVGYTPPHDGT